MRCVTITLNSSVDTTYFLASLHRGGINRVLEKLVVPGGKGNNVARVLATLGHSVIATGFIGGRAGEYIEESLRDEGIDTAFVSVAGESRTSLAIIERASGTITEVREPGPQVSAGDGHRFLDAIPRIAREADVAVISGSQPRGLPDDYYAQLIRVLRRLPVRIVFDSSGDPFRIGLSEQPDLIKPNADEMASLIGREADVDTMVEFAQQRLIGPMLATDASVLLSLGEEGAALVRKTSVLRARAPRIRVASPVGSGDAMIAGYLDAESRLNDDQAVLRHAVATGSAAALHSTQGVVSRADIRRLCAAVVIEA
jgi:tagatose 6-phosphate kinase